VHQLGLQPAYRSSHNLLNLLEGIASENLNSGLVIYAVLCNSGIVHGKQPLFE